MCLDPGHRSRVPSMSAHLPLLCRYPRVGCAFPEVPCLSALVRDGASRAVSFACAVSPSVRSGTLDPNHNRGCFGVHVVTERQGQGTSSWPTLCWHRTRHHTHERQQSGATRPIQQPKTVRRAGEYRRVDRCPIYCGQLTRQPDWAVEHHTHTTQRALTVNEHPQGQTASTGHGLLAHTPNTTQATRGRSQQTRQPASSSLGGGTTAKPAKAHAPQTHAHRPSQRVA